MSRNTVSTCRRDFALYSATSHATLQRHPRVADRVPCSVSRARTSCDISRATGVAECRRVCDLFFNMPVEWSNEAVLKLIELYESKGCLWDTNTKFLGRHLRGDWLVWKGKLSRDMLLTCSENTHRRCSGTFLATCPLVKSTLNTLNHSSVISWPR